MEIDKIIGDKSLEKQVPVVECSGTNNYKTMQGDDDGNLKVSIAGASSGISLGSSSVGGGNNTHSNIQLDYTATPTVGENEIVLSGFVNAVFAAALATANFGNAVIRRCNSLGVWDTIPVSKTILLNEYTTNTTCTLTLGDMVGVFAAGDVVEMAIVGVEKDYDALNKNVDSIVAHIAASDTNVAITANAQVLSGPGKLKGFWIVSHTAGATVRFSDALTATTPYVSSAWTSEASHIAGDYITISQNGKQMATGCYCTIVGTIEILPDIKLD